MMADRSAAEIFSKIFRWLAENPEKYAALIPKVGNYAREFDFTADQMGCWPKTHYKMGLCTRCCRPDARIVTFIKNGKSWSFSVCPECARDKISDAEYDGWKLVSNGHDECSGYENRLRMDRPTADRFLTMHAGAKIMHLLDNEDGTFSILTHIVCEHCDYCHEQGDCRGKEDAVALPAKGNPYEKYGDGRG
jgi:hypothetical protein